MLCLARPCGAWVVFDGKRLEQAVPLGQRAKNSSDVLTAAETMRLFLSDGFPGAFRWSARSSLRYAISPDFCAAMRGTMVEEDNWLRDAWPIKPSIRWATCDRLHQIVRQAFDTWQENNPALHLVGGGEGGTWVVALVGRTRPVRSGPGTRWRTEWRESCSLLECELSAYRTT